MDGAGAALRAMQIAEFVPITNSNGTSLVLSKTGEGSEATWSAGLGNPTDEGLHICVEVAETDKDNGANLALLALVAIPVVCLVGVYVGMRRRRSPGETLLGMY